MNHTHQTKPTWLELALEGLTVTAAVVILGLLACWITIRVAVPDSFRSVDITMQASGQ
jgi:hypothetical protein